jgi:hypothetical protein
VIGFAPPLRQSSKDLVNPGGFVHTPSSVVVGRRPAEIDHDERGKVKNLQERKAGNSHQEGFYGRCESVGWDAIWVAGSPKSSSSLGVPTGKQAFSGAGSMILR